MIWRNRKQSLASVGSVLPLVEIIGTPMSAALNDATGLYEWAPEGLKVFEAETTESESDVAAIKDGNVSVTALKAAFLPS